MLNEASNHLIKYSFDGVYLWFEYGSKYSKFICMVFKAAHAVICLPFGLLFFTSSSISNTAYCHMLYLISGKTVESHLTTQHYLAILCVFTCAVHSILPLLFRFILSMHALARTLSQNKKKTA